MLYHRSYRVVGVTTFGAPKVGGRRFVKECKRVNLKHTRVVTAQDKVPKLPFFRGRQYESNLVYLDNVEFDNFIDAHLGYGEALEEMCNV